MDLEKENTNIKWFKTNGLRIRIKKEEGGKSLISVALDGFNICLKLAMYDFIDRIKEDLSLDVTMSKSWNSQRVLIVDTNNATELVDYISLFVKEWNIRISATTVSDSDIIADEKWYGE